MAEDCTLMKHTLRISRDLRKKGEMSLLENVIQGTGLWENLAITRNKD
jgi:hypothetical protein